MDIRRAYQELQQKYDLSDGVQELFLYEAYLKVCKEYFAAGRYNRAAVYGAGRNTREIMDSVIWEELKSYVKVIVDNRSQERELQGIPIIREQDLRDYGIEVIFISTWEFRVELSQNITRNFPEIIVFEPYKIAMEKLPQINTAFYTYKGNSKYQWFAERRKELETTDNVCRQKLLKELIHGYFAIYDWVDLIDTLLLYIHGQYDDIKKYLCFKKDLEGFLGTVQRKIEKRTQGDCLIFLVDALSKYVVDDMPFLSNWKKKGVSFERYINEYPATREVLTALLTGWHPFEDKTYLAKKIKKNDSELLKNIEKEQIEIKFISAAHSAENYSEINGYIDEIKENQLLTEIIFGGIEELLKCKKRQLIIMHAFDTVHPLHWNPISAEIGWKDTPWEAHRERFQQSIEFTDTILDFYLRMLDSNTEISKIVMGDHGINIETEYAHDIADISIRGNIGLWDMQTLSPALMIWKKGWEAESIDQLVSTNSFHRILYAVVQSQDIHAILEARKFLELEFVPGYDESWLKRAIKSCNYYLGMGMKGIISQNYIFASFENGTERLFEIQGNEITECNDKIQIFISEVGKDNYDSCKFPRDLLKDRFFDKHNQYYGRRLYDSFCQDNNAVCVIRNLDLVITERCSLKCRDCFNCMQYYKKPQDIPLDKIKRELDILTQNVDEIMEMRILGGEPFMNKDLKEITAYVCNKEKVKSVVVYTNATILPDKEELEIFQHKKVSFYLTDYGLDKRQKLKQFEELLTEYGILYHTYRLGYWYKPGEIYDNHKTREELEQTYQFCWGRDCITLLEGKLWQCKFAANANRLGAIPDYKQDYVDLFETDNLRQRLIDFLYTKTSMESCRWCNLTTEKVKPGVQIPHNLVY